MTGATRRKKTTQGLVDECRCTFLAARLVAILGIREIGGQILGKNLRCHLTLPWAGNFDDQIPKTASAEQGRIDEIATVAGADKQ